MKTELRLKPHAILPGANIIEVWHEGEFIGEVTGADGPGVRIISRHSMQLSNVCGPGPNVSEVRVGKHIELVVESEDESRARDQVAEMARRFLSNPVIEDFRILNGEEAKR